MIVDSLSQAKLYDTLNPYFAKAFEYIATIDTQTIAEGRYAIDGDNVFMMVVDNKPLKNRADAALEAHDKYIDIQLVVCGAEGFGWKQRALCTAPRSEMDTQKDIIFYDDAPSTYVTLGAGEFVIFFPEDAHAPLVGEGTVKKCIIKVLA